MSCLFYLSNNKDNSYYLPCPRYFDSGVAFGPTDLCALPFFLLLLGAKVFAETELPFFGFAAGAMIMLL